MTQCLDALQVHAAAAAAATDSDFTDVAVGASMAKGRCVRVYYDGERQSVYFGEGSLNSQHIANVASVEAFWPVPETASATHRLIEIEMSTFAADFRTRVNGDYQLGGGCTALKMLPAVADGPVISGNKYARLTWEIGLDLGDYIYAP